MKNIRGKIWTLFLIIILLIGCKDNNIELPDLELKVLTSEHDSPDWYDWSDTLAIFDTPWSKPLDLSNILTFRNKSDSYKRFQISLTFQEDEIDKRFCLFRILPTDTESDVLITGGSSQITSNPTKRNFSLGADEAYSLFIINGIGDIISSPITINFKSHDNTISDTVLLHPDQMVKNEPTLFIDFSELPRTSENSLSTKYQVKKISDQKEYLPLVVSKINESSSFSAYSTSSNYFVRTVNRAIDDGFELYLFTIDPKQIKL